ncbi:hypothetical protein BST26_00455 [Mycolicibacterium insubricum]|uniref:DUF222 domain-containing protein n=1 Tax=Mycolicibacterium insubricum TaxID=444597 RepID=A0A1X0DP43_9MYCO|nr:hypothetical protein BST26_00455 [Mycolicibacterium insubricum]
MVGRLADRGTVAAALGRLEAAASDFDALNLDALTEADVLAVAERLEAMTRSHAVTDHRVMGRLARLSPREFGAKSVVELLATRLRISRRAVHTRLRAAALLSPQLTVTGPALPPKLPATAAGVADGRISGEHVTVIADFMARLPQRVDPELRAEVEAELAGYATDATPEDLRTLALRLASMIDTDGPLDDEDRARRRGIVIGPQGVDGMSKLTGWVTPQWRATVEVICAKLGAPGMCDPTPKDPCVEGTPSAEQIDGDKRSVEQRTHDALLAAARAVLASGSLGKLNGLPATIVITTTLQDLTDATGVGITAGGTVLPMSDVIREAREAYHYLTVFDRHTNIPLYLGRTRRTASPGQRIVLYARDLGCTFPTCTTPGYRCEIHHCDPWRGVGQTNVDAMAQTCPGHHRMTEGHPNTRWTVRLRKDGLVEWVPPPKLDTDGPRVNNYHHPVRLLTRYHHRPRTTGTLRS